MNNEVAYYRLASLKQRIKLESKGLKFKGGATRPKIAKEFGLTPRAPHAEFVAEIQRRMDVMLEEWAAIADQHLQDTLQE